LAQNGNNNNLNKKLQKERDRILSFLTLGFTESAVESKIRKNFRIEFKPETSCEIDLIMNV